MLYALVICAVLVGIIAQRVAGLGFAMIVAPVLVLLLGPFDGVLLVNLCGGLSAILVITRVWRDIDWRQFLLLSIPAVILIIPGTIISVRFSGPILQIVIGVILLLGLTMSMVVQRSMKRTRTTPTAIICGATAGFTSATAGVGGPPVSIHAVLTRWDQRAFAATVQPYFVITGVVAFAAKVVLAPDGVTSYDWWLWVMIIASMVVGLAIGEVLSRHVSAKAARVAVIAIAYVGAIVAIVDGIRQAA